MLCDLQYYYLYSLLLHIYKIILQQEQLQGHLIFQRLHAEQGLIQKPYQ